MDNVVLREKDLIILREISIHGFHDAAYKSMSKNPPYSKSEFRDFCYRVNIGDKLDEFEINFALDFFL